MAQPSNYTSSSAYSSSSAYTGTSDHQTGGDTTGRKDVPDQSQAAITDTNTSQPHVTTKSGVKIPVLKIKTTPRGEGMAGLPVPVASAQPPASPDRYAPGPKPEFLPGLPGLPLLQATSPRGGINPSDTPSSPASPRRELSPGAAPRRVGTRGELVVPRADKNAGGLSPRSLKLSPSTAADTITNETTTTTAIAVGNATTTTASTTTTAATAASEDATATASSLPAALPLPPPQGSVKIVRVRTRLSSRMLGEEPLSPRTPRSAEWTRVRPTTSDRSLAVPRNAHVPRAQLIADAVKFYSTVTLGLLKEGKPESIKSLGRTDPKIAAEDMPDSLKSFYIYKEAKSFPVAPLLRQLFKENLEATPQWKNTEKLICQALALCNPAIPFATGDKTVKEKEVAKFKPLAEAAINALFPTTKNSNEPSKNDQIRKLSDSFLTKDFIDQVLFAVDRDVIERCKKDPHLSIGDINMIRYSVVFDLIFTRIVCPMIARCFPEMPNQSQTWLQSALGECLKNAMSGIAKDFFEESMKTMPEQHSSFLEKKAKQEEIEAAKKSEKIREQRIADLKEKGTSIRNIKNYNAFADQKKRRDYTKKNTASFDQLVSALNTDQLDDKLAKFIETEISRKLKQYDGLQTLDQIRNDLLFIMKKLPDNEVSQEVKVFISDLAKQVEADTARRIKHMTVAFDPELLKELLELSEMLTLPFGDHTFIDFAVIQTYNGEEHSDESASSVSLPVPVLTTTTSATAPTTTTTAMMTTTATVTTPITTTASAMISPTTTMATPSTTEDSQTGANTQPVAPTSDTQKNL